MNQMHMRRPAVRQFDDEDRGADGPAALARVSRTDTIEGASGGSGHAAPVKITVRRYEVECRLDLLKSRGLDHRLWQAGMIFRKHWYAERWQPSMVAGYNERVGRSLSLQDLERKTQGRQQVDAAYAVLSVAERLIVVAVCGEDEPVGGRGDLLRAGLEKLAEMWVRPLSRLRN